jgi:hypothetical protein
MASFLCYAVSKERKTKLVVTVQIVDESGGEWGIMAIETPHESKGVEDVLAAHAHKVLGTHDGPTKAIAVAEKYVAEWLSGAVSLSDPCGCGEIESAVEGAAP